MARDVPDAILIDRVFQPIADLLAHRISCFKLSFFFVDGTYVANIFQNINLVRTDLISFGLVCAVYTPTFLFMRYLFVWNARLQKPNTLNYGRYSFVFLRILSLIMIGFATFGLFRESVYSYTMLAIATYFSSCRYQTPNNKFKKPKGNLLPQVT